MLKNKKSLVLESLVRLVVTIGVLLLIVFPAGERVYTAFFGSDTKYLQSFEEFVNNINDMRLERETFSIRLREESAIAGFSKNSDKFECYNCYVGVQDRPTIIFNKPKTQDCSGRACICLCKDDFKLNNDILNGKTIKVAECEELTCKSLNKDIVENLPVKIYPGFKMFGFQILGGAEYWKNGFLFANGVTGTNGLKLYNQESNNLIVEKRQNFIGICNPDMLKYNLDELKTDRCIVTEKELNKEKEKEVSVILESALKKVDEKVCSKTSPTETCNQNAKLAMNIAKGKLGEDAARVSLGLAWQESAFKHCRDGSTNCGNENIENVNCNDAGSCGILQLNKKAHCAWFNPKEICIESKKPQDFGCTSSKYNTGEDCKLFNEAGCEAGQTAYDLDCNARLGITFLRFLYLKYGQGVSYSCTNELGSVKKAYFGYNAALRAYNGLGCGEFADPNYVENINKKLIELI
jgi:hypothetical protein